jgi:hypothetical protein
MLQWTGPSQVILSPINISTPLTLNYSFTKGLTTSTLFPVPLFQPAPLCLQSSSGIVEVGSLVTKKCHTTRVAKKTRNNICCPPPSFPGLSFYVVRVYTPVYPKPGRVFALWYFWFLTWILLQKIRTSPFPSPCDFALKEQSRLFLC